MVLFMQKLSDLLSRRRTIYSMLLGIILLTLPCYVIGFVALGIAPRDRATPTPTQMMPTLFVLATSTNTVATPTLGELPTQFVAPTLTPHSDVSATPTPIISAPPKRTPKPTATLDCSKPKNKKQCP